MGIAMPSRILLISANRCTTPDAVFPLGLAHLNAALRQAGHSRLWLDSLAGTARLALVYSLLFAIGLAL